MGFLVTCEHGSPWVPESVAELLGATAEAGRYRLDSDYDMGAAEIAERFAEELACPLISAPCHPAVIDCNRPVGHRRLLSRSMRAAAPEVREQLIRDVHQRHERRVRERLDEVIRRDGQVIHLAVHSFAPFEPGAAPAAEDRPESARRTDLGLLYDPQRPLEALLCDLWAWRLYETLPMLRVRRNYPVRGTRVGLTKRLRQQHAPEQYLGIELQLNQAWCARPLSISHQTRRGIAAALLDLCDRQLAFAA